jgi:hypothetical protein
MRLHAPFSQQRVGKAIRIGRRIKPAIDIVESTKSLVWLPCASRHRWWVSRHSAFWILHQALKGSTWSYNIAFKSLDLYCLFATSTESNGHNWIKRTQLEWQPLTQVAAGLPCLRSRAPPPAHIHRRIGLQLVVTVYVAFNHANALSKAELPGHLALQSSLSMMWTRLKERRTHASN